MVEGLRNEAVEDVALFIGIESVMRTGDMTSMAQRRSRRWEWICI